MTGDLGVYERDVNFGALASLPAGYRVLWDTVVEAYFATDPADVEYVTGCRYACRRWCFEHAASSGERS
jgi:hypothetical protein